MDFFVAAIVVIIALAGVRMFIRRQLGSGLYIEVFQTTSRRFLLPEILKKELDDAGIRYRITYQEPPGQPFGMTGQPFLTVKAHVEDLEKAKRVLAKVLQDEWRGGTQP